MFNQSLQKKIDALIQMHLSRREFVSATASTAVLSALPFASCTKSEPIAKSFQFSKLQLKELIAVQNHLLPSEQNSPGAKDINAFNYLEMTMNQPGFDPEIRDFIKTGINRLIEFVQQSDKQDFSTLNEQQREEILNQIQHESWGEGWTSVLLIYLFEALLSDPVYSGNPDEIGWKWLQHTSGLPRPTQATRFEKQLR